jgi:hypothetical protein
MRRAEIPRQMKGDYTAGHSSVRYEGRWFEYHEIGEIWYMGRQVSEHEGEADAEKRSEKTSGGKRTYEPPRLVTYGKLREISLGNKGGNKNDSDTGLARTHR